MSVFVTSSLERPSIKSLALWSTSTRYLSICPHTSKSRVIVRRITTATGFNSVPLGSTLLNAGSLVCYSFRKGRESRKSSITLETTKNSKNDQFRIFRRNFIYIYIYIKQCIFGDSNDFYYSIAIFSLSFSFSSLCCKFYIFSHR